MSKTGEGGGANRPHGTQLRGALTALRKEINQITSFPYFLAKQSCKLTLALVVTRLFEPLALSILSSVYEGQTLVFLRAAIPWISAALTLFFFLGETIISGITFFRVQRRHLIEEQLTIDKDSSEDAFRDLKRRLAAQQERGADLESLVEEARTSNKETDKS